MKHLLYSLAIILLATSCGSDDDNIGGPDTKYDRNVILAQWPVADAGPVMPEDIDWAVHDSTINILSTMSVVTAAPIEIPEDSVSNDDRIAFFSADECLGVAKPFDTPYGKRFMTNVFKPSFNSKLLVAYYSALRHRAYYWHQEMFYSEDAVMGHMDTPYPLSIAKATQYRYMQMIYFYAPADFANVVSNDDVIGFFSGNECRAIVPQNQMFMEKRYAFGYAYLRNRNESIQVRQFCVNKGRIYATAPVACNVDRMMSLLHPSSWTEIK